MVVVVVVAVARRRRRKRRGTGGEEEEERRWNKPIKQNKKFESSKHIVIDFQKISSQKE